MLYLLRVIRASVVPMEQRCPAGVVEQLSDLLFEHALDGGIRRDSVVEMHLAVDEVCPRGRLQAHLFANLPLALQLSHRHVQRLVAYRA